MNWKTMLNETIAKEKEQALELARKTAMKQIPIANEKIIEIMHKGEKVALGICLGNLNVFRIDVFGRRIEPAALILCYAEHALPIFRQELCPEAIQVFWDEYFRLLQEEYGITFTNGKAFPLE